MAHQTRVISVVGKKDCGKTTLVVALARMFARKGLDVGTIKHGTHPANLDTEGTDTWRHAKEGQARRVMLVSGQERVFFESGADEHDPLHLVRASFAGADIVVLEGFTDSTVPKIEVFRSEIHDSPRWNADRDNAHTWVAMLLDDTTVDVPFPTFRFDDTAWLVALKALAWDHAVILES